MKTKTIFHKLISVMLCLMLSLAMCLPFAQTAQADGGIGEGLTWSLSESGVLTIKPTKSGAKVTMNDFTAPITTIGEKQYKITTAPWGSSYASIKSVVIESGVQNIGHSAFCGCVNIESVSIPSTVTQIGAEAFSNNQSLKKVKIPSGVTEIKDYAFYNCVKLSTVEVSGENLKSVGEYAFSRCEKLYFILLPDSVETIDFGAFQHCTTLTNFIVPAGVTEISGQVFCECYELQNVNIPDGVKSIGDSAFESCKSLTHITLPAELTYIGADAFNGNVKLKSITIPSKVTKIYVRAFIYDAAITDVYYMGSKAEWDKIEINGDNDAITGATMHYAHVDLEDIYIKNLSDDRILTWFAVGGANQYRVRIAGRSDCEKFVVDPTFDLKQFDSNLTKEKYYDVKLCALDASGKEITEEWTGTFYYGDKKSQLAAPTPKIDSDGLLSWGLVPDATEYNVCFYCMKKSNGWDNLIKTVDSWTGTWLNYRNEMTQEFYYRYSICAVDSTGEHTQSPTVYSDWVTCDDGEFYGIYVERIPVTSKNCDHVLLDLDGSLETVKFYLNGSEEYGTTGKTLVLNNLNIDKGRWHTSEDGCNSLISIDADINVVLIGNNTIDLTWEDDLYGLYILPENNVHFYGDGTLDIKVSQNGGRALSSVGSFIYLCDDVTLKLSGNYGMYSGYDGEIGDLNLYDRAKFYAYGLRTDADKEGRAVLCPYINIEDLAYFYAEYEWNQRAVETWGSDFCDDGQSNLIIKGIKNVSGKVNTEWTELASINQGSGQPHEEDYRALEISSNKPQVKVTAIAMSDASVHAGGTVKLTATISPSNASNKSLSWSSSDKKIATVSANGVVTGVAKGTVTITAAAKDLSGVSATCKVTVEGHSMEHYAAVAATCTAAGNSEYWYCTTCKKYFSDAAGTTEIAKDSWVIPKLDHAMEHHEAVAATCTAAGNSEYWYCTTCKKYYGDAAGTTEIAKDSWVIKQLDHDYTGAVPTFNWNGYACTTATFKCTGCSHTETAAVTVTSKVTKEAGAEEAGTRQYTAKCTFAGKEYTDVRTETIPATGHDFTGVKPVFNWNGYECANATFKCKDCTHTVTATVYVTNEITTQPGCLTTGVRTYTATCTFLSNTFTEVKTEEVKAAGHSMEPHAAVAATATTAGNSEYWYCTTCKKYFSDAAGTTEIEKDSWIIPKLGSKLVESVKLDKTSVSAGTSVTEINEKNGNPVKSSGNLVVTKASTVQLTATVSPANAVNKSLTWKSSDETVATVDKNGLVTVLRYGKATITATANDGSDASAACTVQGKFYDVNGSATKGETDYQYFYNPVYWAADNGITTGYDYVYFGTDRNCSRRELMIFLWRMAGKPGVSEYTSASTPYVDPYTAFSDMGGYGKSTATYQAVAWGVTVGITKGFGDGTFRPDANITRKDTMIMIYRAAGKPKWNWNASRTEDDFNNTYCSDVKSICKPGSDTYNSIAWAYTNKITNGYTSGDHKGKFGYELDILRKDIVTFLYRYNNLK